MATYQRFIKHQHTNWDRFAETASFQAMLGELATQEPLKNGRLMEISNQTGVPRNTLKTWRRKLKKDKDYVPKHGRVAQCISIPRPAIEALIRTAKMNFVDQGRYLPPAGFASLAREVGRQENESFKASRTWIKTRLKEANLSFRKPHLKRRTEPDDRWVAAFTADVDAAMMQYPDNLIFNADETFWRVVNGTMKTLAVRGSDNVTVRVPYDIKDGLTVMVTANMAGQILPPCVILKGMTEKVVDNYRKDLRLRHLLQSHLLVLKHSPNGWMNESLATQYLDFLSEYVGGRHCFLLWDVHASHRTNEVKKKAEELGIGMTFVPAGQTPTWQPLDNKLFGMIKRRAHTIFNEQVMKKEDQDIVDALVILVTVVQELKPEQVRKAWRMFADAVEADEDLE